MIAALCLLLAVAPVAQDRPLSSTTAPKTPTPTPTSTSSMSPSPSPSSPRSAAPAPPAAAVTVVPAPTITRGFLAPVAADGLALSLDTAAAFSTNREGLAIEASACATPALCRGDAIARRAHLITVKVRRIADLAVVSVTMISPTDQLAAEVTDTAPVAELTPLAHRTMNRLAQRFAAAAKRAADTDGDTLIGIDDQCPGEAGAIAMKGCPDGDGDGVPNHLDRCAAIVGSIDNGGCGAVVLASDPPPPPPPSGPEWGRITGGALATLLGSAAGAAAGTGAAVVALSQIGTSQGYAPGPRTTVGVYAAGAGVGALLGTLTPDVGCAGLCGYPLSAAWPTRLVASVVTAGAAAGGGALLGNGVFTNDPMDLWIGGGVMAAGALAGAIVVAAGNGISGPPGERAAAPVAAQP